jgi:hypothetical protein
MQKPDGSSPRTQMLSLRQTRHALKLQHWAQSNHSLVDVAAAPRMSAAEDCHHLHHARRAWRRALEICSGIIQRTSDGGTLIENTLKNGKRHFN